MNASTTLALAGAAVFLLPTASMAKVLGSGNQAVGTIPVTASVSASCTVAAENLAFGIYDPLVAQATSDLVQTTPISVTCTQSSAPMVSVSTTSNDAGNSTTPGGTAAASFMTGPNASQLSYTFSLDNPAIKTGLSNPTYFQLTGDIASHQDVPTGSYSDGLVVTVLFGAPTVISGGSL